MMLHSPLNINKMSKNQVRDIIAYWQQLGRIRFLIYDTMQFFSKSSEVYKSVKKLVLAIIKLYKKQHKNYWILFET